MTTHASVRLFALLTTAGLLTACGGGSTEPAAPAVPPTEVAAIDTPPPVYSMELACAGAAGQSVLNVEIGVEGKPTRIDLARSSGVEALDTLALESVKGWTFRPATRNGQPVAKTIQVPMNFRAPDIRPDACFALDARRGG